MGQTATIGFHQSKNFSKLARQPSGRAPSSQKINLQTGRLGPWEDTRVETLIRPSGGRLSVSPMDDLSIIGVLPLFFFQVCPLLSRYFSLTNNIIISLSPSHRSPYAGVWKPRGIAKQKELWNIIRWSCVLELMDKSKICVC